MTTDIRSLTASLPDHVTVVVVSKTRTPDEILDVYRRGHHIFGENRVQELTGKRQQLPGDIKWHMVGHLQTNKVKYIAPFVDLIHSVDSLKLLRTINKEAGKNDRVIPCLLEVRIAREESKFGLGRDELFSLFQSDEYRDLNNVDVRGLMGMATFTGDEQLIRREFRYLRNLFDELKSAPFRQKESFSVLSMGMTGDYQIAIEEGSNMIRIGTLIFGPRQARNH